MEISGPLGSNAQHSQMLSGCWNAREDHALMESGDANLAFWSERGAIYLKAQHLRKRQIGLLTIPSRASMVECFAGARAHILQYAGPESA